MNASIVPVRCSRSPRWTAAAFVGLALVCALSVQPTFAQTDPCEVVDDGSGTVSLPPEGCAYLSGAEVHEIIDGLPIGTTIELAPIHLDFICRKGGGGPHCGQPGGGLGGEFEVFDSTLDIQLTGTGDLAGFSKALTIPVFCQTDTGPRNPGDAVQDFPSEMVQLQGSLFGDPDFDSLTIVGGSANGLPSPGNTTLTRLGPPGSDFQVDSFFDISYRIDFVGAPGGALDGMAGSTTASIRMEAAAPPPPPDPCEVVDDGTGTVSLPPEGCEYLSPAEVHMIIDGLPAGTTIELAPIHLDFICRQGGGGAHCGQPGGPLGGETETFDSTIGLQLTGTGDLAGFSRTLQVPLFCQAATGPRVPGDAVQDFDNEMVQLQGSLFGDPDFDTLTIVGGSANGLPSPGHTTLTRLGPPGSDFQVDSFFDITYRIDFQGAPGGALSGMGGSTTGTIHMEAQAGTPPAPSDPCDACGPGPHWADTCPGGDDIIDSTAEVEIDTDLDGIADETLILSGPVVVRRSAGTPTGTFQTEMISMSLSGSSGATLVAGAGQGAGGTLPPSTGQVQEQATDPAVADSFFDVWTEITLTSGLVLRNLDPIRVEAVITCVPPQADFVYGPNPPVQLVDESGLPVAQIIKVIHYTFPPPPPPDHHLTIDPTTVEFGFGTDVPAIPAGFFGPGSDPFEGQVGMQGPVPDEPSVSLQRDRDPVAPSDPAGASGTVQIEIVALDLVSMAPITVTYGTGVDELWDVRVSNIGSSGKDGVSQGSLSATKTHANGGTFNAEFSFCPVIHFTRLSDGISQTLDLCPSVPADPTEALVLNLAGDFVHVVDATLDVEVADGANWVSGVQQALTGTQQIVPITATSKDFPPSVIHTVKPPKKKFCVYQIVCVDGDCSQCPAAAAGACVGAACPNNTCGVMTGLTARCPAGSNCCIEFGQFDCRPPGNLPACPPIDPDQCVCDPLPGACCTADGACTQTLENDCQGTFLGEGTTCGPDEACCFDDGSCSVMARACCVEFGGTPSGAATCGPQGACCDSTGNCTFEYEACCTGTFHAGDCQPLVGCCLPDGSCADLDPNCCVDLGGTPKADGTLCAQPEACCYPGPVGLLCTMTDPECCTTKLGGTPLGAGSFCLGDNDGDGNDDACVSTPDLCPLPPGVDWCAQLQATDCIANDPTNEVCLIRVVSNMPGAPPTVTECDCFVPGPGCGVVEFDGQTVSCPGDCDPLPGICEIHVDNVAQGVPSAPISMLPAGQITCACADPTGACCDAAGNCSVTTQANCQGTWLGAGTVCQGVQACCIGNACTMMDAACCAAQGGSPQGAGSTCSPAAEACCFTDGSCAMLDRLCCADQGGTPQGAGSVCLGDGDGDGHDDLCVPPVTGACCTAAGGCTITTQANCPGLWAGPNTVCQGIQACCVNNACTMMDATCCTAQGGTPQGPGSGCSPAPEACCFADGTCADLDPLCCFDQGGTPQGAGSHCLGDLNGNNIDDACEQACEPFDADGDGIADACTQIVCPDATQACQPRCVTVDPLTGVSEVVECDCRGIDDCHADIPGAPGVPCGGPVREARGGTGNACVVTPVGGTAVLPPAGCDYLSADDVHEILDGLPGGTTIELGPMHSEFQVTSTIPGGTLGGEIEEFNSILILDICGTGALGGFNRTIAVPILCETHTAPRVPFTPVQSFDTDMFRLQGGIFGDPDFDTLTLTGGTDNGLPSPGHTTLTELPGGNFVVDSFFDISYRIDFVGAPGSVLDGMAGSTTATIRMATGTMPKCVGACPPGETCTDTTTVNSDGTVTLCCDCGVVELGACCYDVNDGPLLYDQCVETDQATCDANGGFFQGPGTVCQLEACCLPTGHCREADPGCCLASGGTPQGPGSDCTTVVCPAGDCVPTADAQACEQVLCTDGTNDECLPKCVNTDPLTGQTRVTDCGCAGANDCHVVIPGPAGVPCDGAARGGPANPCVVADTGGTVVLPPPGCPYLSPEDVHEIVDGLPVGTTIELGAEHTEFILRNGGPGGNLGGEFEEFDSILVLQLCGTGDLGSFTRFINIPVFCETHTGPRTPGDPVQSFPTDMFRLQGGIFGDPDFDTLTVTGGTDNGLPSPGHTTLTQLPSGNFAVDSFFDITYRIDFQGAPGSVLEGFAGSTTATITMGTGDAPHCEGNCPPNTTCRETRIVNADGTIDLCCECVTPVVARPMPDADFAIARAVTPCTSDADCVAGINAGSQTYCVLPPGGVPGPGTCYVQRNRYVSIDPNPENAGTLTARRVSLDLGGGTTAVLGWIDEPIPTTVAGPEVTPQLLARLTDEASRHYRDWSVDNTGAAWAHATVHLGDCQTSPQHTYLIQAIGEGADITDDANYSEALSLRTVHDFGDVVGATPGTPPDSVRNFKDISAVVRGFQSTQSEPKCWLDLQGANATPELPDFSDINFADINHAVAGFQGGNYPFAQPLACP